MGATLFTIFFCLILAFGFYLTIQILAFALQSMLESYQRAKREKRMRFWIANAHDILGEDSFLVQVFSTLVTRVWVV